jgi:transposase
MGKLRTLTYPLDDGQTVTARQVAEHLGVTESAARNRLNRHTDPVKVFAPYNKAKGGKPRGKQKKEQKLLPYEDPMLKLLLKTI